MSIQRFAVGALLILTLATNASADAWQTFTESGWVLLRVDAHVETRIRWEESYGEGYRYSVDRLFAENGTQLWTRVHLGQDIGPGLYVDSGLGTDVVVAPNPPMSDDHVCFSCGGSGATLGDQWYPPGVYYLLLGVGGEFSYWTLDAPRSTIVASGPTFFKWGSDLEGAPFVEANGGYSSVSASAGERILEFDIEHELFGEFGVAGPFSPQVGNATLTTPEEVRRQCPCVADGGEALGPDTYRYQENRAGFNAFRIPVAFWMDVPLPWR